MGSSSRHGSDRTSGLTCAQPSAHSLLIYVCKPLQSSLPTAVEVFANQGGVARAPELTEVLGNLCQLFSCRLTSGDPPVRPAPRRASTDPASSRDSFAAAMSSPPKSRRAIMASVPMTTPTPGRCGRGSSPLTRRARVNGGAYPLVAALLAYGNAFSVAHPLGRDHCSRAARAIWRYGTWSSIMAKPTESE